MPSSFHDKSSKSCQAIVGEIRFWMSLLCQRAQYGFLPRSDKIFFQRKKWNNHPAAYKFDHIYFVIFIQHYTIILPLSAHDDISTSPILTRNTKKENMINQFCLFNTLRLTGTHLYSGLYTEILLIVFPLK